ncbi:hypothetical protein RHS03_03425, partial [Rhizoctonia solani]
MEVERMADLIFRCATGVPLNFLVTSRPEPEIYPRMMQHNSQSRVVIHLHKIEKSLVRADIELFLKGELSSTSATPLETDQLVERSGALFVYASMLVRFVTSGEPQKRLETVPVLTPNTQSASGEEYAPEDGEKEDIRFVLQTVLVAQEPNGIEIIVILAEINGLERVVYALRPLRSVVHQSNQTKLVPILRASFPDFVFSNERAGSDFFDQIKSSCGSTYVTSGPRLWSTRMWSISKTESERIYPGSENGLSTGDPGRLSVEPVPVLDGGDRYQARDDHGIGTLIKAKDWLVDVGPGREFMTLVEDCLNFFTGLTANSVSRLTPHIYVSSVPSCPSLMGSREGATLATWSTPSPVCSVTYDLQGARAPTGCYGGNLSTRNAHGGDLVLGPFEIDVRDLGDDTTSFLMGPLTITGCVVPTSYFCDGTRIATASRGGRLRICSTRNGKILADPFCGDKPYACSTAFSSDGSYAVSASRQDPIRFWNATAGMHFTQHPDQDTGLSCCTAYSRDGKYIPFLAKKTASSDSSMGLTVLPSKHLFLGSSDGATRTRNVSDGTPATKPLEGPHCPVNSVAISPDGAYATSGSDDATIRILDIDDGTPFAGPFSGHTNKVHSVTYSNDDLASSDTSSLVEDQVSDTQTGIFSADDQSIWIWESQQGSLIAKIMRVQTPTQNVNQRYPIIEHGLGAEYRVCQRHCRAVQGHPDIDTTASFSHADARVVTASKDRTVRVCSIESGELASGPFTGLWNLDDSILEINTTTLNHSVSPTSSGSISSAFAGWTVNVGEWSTSGDSSLLLWLPADLASAPAPHTGLIITGSGSLIIPKQKLLLGKDGTIGCELDWSLVPAEIDTCMGPTTMNLPRDLTAGMPTALTSYCLRRYSRVVSTPYLHRDSECNYGAVRWSNFHVSTGETEGKKRRRPVLNHSNTTVQPFILPHTEKDALLDLGAGGLTIYRLWFFSLVLTLGRDLVTRSLDLCKNVYWTAYLKIKTPSPQHPWQIGQSNGLSWVSAFEGVTQFDIELARLKTDGLLFVARNVSTSWNNLNIHLDSVPTGDDYYVLFLDSTHGNVYSMSERFSILAAGSTPTSGTVAAANAGANEVTLKGGPNPTAQFAYTFVSENAALGGWRNEWVSRGVGIGMGAVGVVFGCVLTVW